MFAIRTPFGWPPASDTVTIRSALRDLRDDLNRVPQFHPAAQALDTAIQELEIADRELRSALDSRRCVIRPRGNNHLRF